ncbi:MAG: hemerythrin family protein [Rhodocyclaceae bacterium]|nr:hemerythrin family protein [Rhodocyclaceae bacterium]
MLINEWNPALEVGVDEMDEDHRTLFGLLIRVQRASDCNDRVAAMGVLKELSDYTEWHFAREEALMRRHGYEFAAEHREEHQRLARQVAHMVADLDHGHVVPQDVATFLQRWLIGHIAGADRHAGEAIARARRKAATT